MNFGPGNRSADKVFGAQAGFSKLLNIMNTARSATTLGDLGVSSLCDASVRDGLLDGKAICKAPQSDTVRIEASFAGGALDGSFVVHDQTGNNTFVDLSFKGGEPDGKMKIYSPKTGKLIHTATWDAGVLSGEEEGFDETTGNRVLQATLANGKYDGEFTRYVPDGNQIIYQANFVHGQHDGDEESFDPQTGKMTGEAHYASGKLQGVVRHWNADGKLLDEKTYDNGVDVEAAKKEAADKDADREADQALNDPAISGCISKLRGAYKEANNTNIDRDEMILAWRDQCQKQSAAAQPGNPQTIPAQPSSAQAVSMSNTSNGTAAASVTQVVSDGPAAKRCGWIENEMPSNLTLKDRDGTWSISSADSQADGFSQMPDTNKGDSCGCLTVETNRRVMHVTRVLGGKIIPVATCQHDTSLG